MPPDLSENYYLDNVKTLFNHVEAVYADILEPEQLNFLDNFHKSSDDAQKLLIRLLNRSNTLFRQSKLDYPEINSIPLAIEKLNSSNFIEVNPRFDKEEILPLFNKAELIEISENAGRLKKLKREELDKQLLKENNATFFQKLSSSDSFIQVLNQNIYQLMQMLFFGNLNQSMTDFVLRDLGLYQFENYTVDVGNRPYRSTEEINQHWLLHQLHDLIESTGADNANALLDCFSMIPDCNDQQSPVYRKSERLKFDIARQFERLGELNQAMLLYRQCRLPPSRERQARIHHRRAEILQAIDLCQAIIEVPIDESEYQFASEFAGRLIKQNRLEPIPGLPCNTGYKPEIIELELIKQVSVEQAVVDYYQNQNSEQTCFYLENTLFNGVLGLLIWDAVFAPVAGAFYNPFQYRPGDYYAFDFIQKRKHILDPVWSSIHNNDDIQQRVLTCWQGKHGLANPLVDWRHLNLDIICLALQRIPYAHWLAIFRRLLLDLRVNRSGFPDLLHFPAEGDYMLIEVKGPGDNLQKNQQRWMQYFDQHDIPHCLARVSWLET